MQQLMLMPGQMDQLRSEVALMARKAEAIFDRSVLCIQSYNEKDLDEVRRMDAELDELELALDQRCMELLLLKEPYAFDFRYVFSAVKITRELERVGDQSKTIAKWARRLRGTPSKDLMDLARRAQDALASAVQALINTDAAAAERVLQIEHEIDAIEDRIIEGGSPQLPDAFLAKALERVGDLATNIAESVIFTVNARDIRHGHFESPITV